MCCPSTEFPLFAPLVLYDLFVLIPHYELRCYCVIDVLF
jgi:hypothetical protein